MQVFDTIQRILSRLNHCECLHINHGYTYGNLSFKTLCGITINFDVVHNTHEYLIVEFKYKGIDQDTTTTTTLTHKTNEDQMIFVDDVEQTFNNIFNEVR